MFCLKLANSAQLVCHPIVWGFPGSSLGKALPAMQETPVQYLGQEDPLQKEMATHSSILAWEENPMDRGAWRAAVHEVAKVWTRLSD